MLVFLIYKILLYDFVVYTWLFLDFRFNRVVYINRVKRISWERSSKLADNFMCRPEKSRSSKLISDLTRVYFTLVAEHWL